MILLHEVTQIGFARLKPNEAVVSTIDEESEEEGSSAIWDRKGRRSIKGSGLILISVVSNIIWFIYAVNTHFFLHFVGLFILGKDSTFQGFNF